MHFHCPSVVYIYDMRAAAAIRHVTRRLMLSPALAKLKNSYAAFYIRCEVYRRELEKKLGERLKPRDVDKVLLAVYQRMNG
jgi:hypothetical protein